MGTGIEKVVVYHSAFSDNHSNSSAGKKASLKQNKLNKDQ